MANDVKTRFQASANSMLTQLGNVVGEKVLASTTPEILVNLGLIVDAGIITAVPKRRVYNEIVEWVQHELDRLDAKPPTDEPFIAWRKNTGNTFELFKLHGRLFFEWGEIPKLSKSLGFTARVVGVLMLYSLAIALISVLDVGWNLSERSNAIAGIFLVVWILVPAYSLGSTMTILSRLVVREG